MGGLVQEGGACVVVHWWFWDGSVGERCLHCLRRDDNLGDVSVVRWSLRQELKFYVGEVFFSSTPKQVKDSNITFIGQHRIFIPVPHAIYSTQPNQHGPLPHVPRRHGHGRLKLPMPDERTSSPSIPPPPPSTPPSTDLLHTPNPR